jgi:hypothetical protein
MAHYTCALPWVERSWQGELKPGMLCVIIEFREVKGLSHLGESTPEPDRHITLGKFLTLCTLDFPSC